MNGYKYFLLLAKAEAELRGHNPLRAGELLDDGCPENLRGWEWRCLKNLWELQKKVVNEPPDANRLAFHPRKDSLAIAYKSPIVIIWNWSEKKHQKLQGKHEQEVICLAFHPTRQFLASAGMDKKIIIWDLDKGESLSLRGHADHVWALAFSLDGKIMASTGRDGSVILWRTATWEILDVLEIEGEKKGIAHNKGVRVLTFSMTEKEGVYVLGSACLDNIVKLWQIAPGDNRFLEPLRGYTGGAFGPRRWVAVAREDGQVTIYDNAKKVPPQILEHCAEVYGVAFNQGEDRVAIGSGKSMKVWQLPVTPEAGGRPQLVREFAGVRGFALAHDGKKAATLEQDGLVRVTLLEGKDQEFLEYPFQPLQDRDSLANYGEHVLSLAYTPDNKYLATAAAVYKKDDFKGKVGGKVILWELSTGKKILVLEKDHAGQDLAKVDRLAFSPDGRRLALACGDNRVLLWNIASALAERPDVNPGKNPLYLVGNHAGEVWAVAFHPKQPLLASAGKDQKIKLWDVTDPARPRLERELVDELVGHQAPIQSLAFSPDGSRLLSTSDDKTAKLWDVSSGKVIQEFTEHRRAVMYAAFSPDGKQLATGSDDGEIILWNLPEAKMYQKLHGHTRGVFGLAFHPTESRLASAGQDMTVRLWDLVSGQEALALKSNTRFFGLAFSPDGRQLAAASGGGVRLWDAK